MKGYRVNWRVGVSGEPYIWRLVYRFDYRTIYNGKRATHRRHKREEPRLGFQVYVKGAGVCGLFLDHLNGGAVGALAAAIVYRDKKVGMPLNADEYVYRDQSHRTIALAELHLPKRPIAPRRDEKVISMHVYREERAARKATPAVRRHAPSHHVGAGHG